MHRVEGSGSALLHRMPRGAEAQPHYRRNLTAPLGHIHALTQVRLPGLGRIALSPESVRNSNSGDKRPSNNR